MPKPSSESPRRGRKRILVGVTGASGAPYAVRLVERAVRAGRDVSVLVTRAGRMVVHAECGPAEARRTRDETMPEATDLWPLEVARHVTLRPAEDLWAPPASGSFPVEATVLIPCSMNTLAAVAAGRAANLVQRAAAVALKEGRSPVIVPREMPVSPIDLENMARLARIGAVVMPAMPGFYHGPETVSDLVDFVVAKVLGRLGIEHGLETRWSGAEDPA